MNNEHIQKVIDMMRDPSTRQTAHALHRPDGSFCALGCFIQSFMDENPNIFYWDDSEDDTYRPTFILRRVADNNYQSASMLPREVTEWLGAHETSAAIPLSIMGETRDLYELNDEFGLTLSALADMIVEDLGI